MAGNWREIEAEWQGGGSFIGRNPAGGMVQMGKPSEGAFVSPMELILVGLAGCTGIDVVDIMAKKREPLKALKVKVRGRRTENHPMVYEEVEVLYLLWGDDLNPQSVERAIQLSEEKYCSVSAMLCSVAEIHSSYQIFSSSEVTEE